MLKIFQRKINPRQVQILTFHEHSEQTQHYLRTCYCKISGTFEYDFSSASEIIIKLVFNISTHRFYSGQ